MSEDLFGDRENPKKHMPLGDEGVSGLLAGSEEADVEKETRVLHIPESFSVAPGFLTVQAGTTVDFENAPKTVTPKEDKDLAEVAKTAYNQ